MSDLLILVSFILIQSVNLGLGLGRFHLSQELYDISFQTNTRDVGSISSLRGGGTRLLGHFFLKKKGTFSEINRAHYVVYCKNWGHVPQCPPVPTSMTNTKDFQSHGNQWATDISHP